MKKSFSTALYTVFLVCVFVFAFAQKSGSSYTAPDMPVDNETKLITYSNVVEVPGISKEEIYRRTLEWFNSYYKNPTESLRERDSVNAKLVGKPRFRIMNEGNENGVRSDGGVVQYTITVAARDGRAKYTISEINWKQASYFPIEKWVEQKDRYKQNNYYLFQTDSIIKKDVVPSLVKAMKTAPVKSNKDNW